MPPTLRPLAWAGSALAPRYAAWALLQATVATPPAPPVLMDLAMPALEATDRAEAPPPAAAAEPEAEAAPQAAPPEPVPQAERTHRRMPRRPRTPPLPKPRRT
jgi:hypothetical protein